VNWKVFSLVVGALFILVVGSFGYSKVLGASMQDQALQAARQDERMKSISHDLQRIMEAVGAKRK